MVRACLLLLFSLGICAAQDRHDWKSVAGITAGEKVKISLKTGKSISGIFRAWTPDGATIDSRTVGRDEVKKVERLRGGGRLKHMALGAIIGAGGGFVIGVAAGGCRQGDFLCITRPEAGAAVGAVGLVIGTAIGAALPAHSHQVIYQIA